MRNSQKQLINSDDLEKEIEHDTLNIYRMISFENFFIKTSKFFSYTFCVILISIITVISTCIIILHYKPFTIPAIQPILKKYLNPVKFSNHEIVFKNFHPHILLYSTKYKNFEIHNVDLSINLKESFLKKHLVIDKIILIKPNIEIYKTNKNFFIKTNLSQKNNSTKIEASLQNIINIFFNNKIEIKNGSIKIFDEQNNIAYFKNISSYKNKNSVIKLSVNNDYNNGNVEISYNHGMPFFTTTFNNIPYNYIKFFLAPKLNIQMKNSFLTGKIITYKSDNFQKHDFIIKSPISELKFNNEKTIITNLFIKGAISKNLTNITQLSFFSGVSNLNINNFKICDEGFFLENANISCSNLKNSFIQKILQLTKYHNVGIFSKFDIKNCNFKVSGLLSKQETKINNIEGTIHMQKANIISKNFELTNLNLKGSFKNKDLHFLIQSGLFNKFNNVNQGDIKKSGDNVQITLQSSLPISILKQYLNDDNIKNISGYLFGNFLIESKNNFKNFTVKKITGHLKIENSHILNHKLYSKDTLNFNYVDDTLNVNGTLFVANKPINLKNYYKDYSKNKSIIKFSGEFDSALINTLAQKNFFHGTSVNEIYIVQNKNYIKYKILSDIKKSDICIPNIVLLKKSGENGIGTFDINQNKDTTNISFNISTEKNNIYGNISNKSKKISNGKIAIKGDTNINIAINNDKYTVTGNNISVITNDILNCVNGNFIINLTNVKYNSITFDIKGIAKIYNSILNNAEINISGKNILCNINAKSNTQISNINITTTNPIFFVKLLNISQQDILNLGNYGELSINYIQDKKTDKKNGKIKLKNFMIKNTNSISNMLTLTSINGSNNANYIGFNKFTCNFNTFKNLISLNDIMAVGPIICFTGNGLINTSTKNLRIQGNVINDYYKNNNLYAKYIIKNSYESPTIGVSNLIKDKEENINKIFEIKNTIKTYIPQLDKQPLHLTF